MTELRFHKELYPGEQVDAAATALAAYATIDRAEEPTHWVLKVTATSPERERRVCGELANRTLGLTVKAVR